MKLIYSGPHRDVEIAATGQIVVRGEATDVQPDDIAKGLLAQADWTTNDDDKDGGS